MIYLVHRPISGDLVGMTWDELNEFLAVPDHKGLDIKVETAVEIEQHICSVMPAEVPRDQVPTDAQVERLRAAASRLLALDDAFNIVGQFKRDWATADRHGDLVEIARDRLREALQEAEA